MPVSCAERRYNHINNGLLYPDPFHSDINHSSRKISSDAQENSMSSHKLVKEKIPKTPIERNSWKKTICISSFLRKFPSSLPAFQGKSLKVILQPFFGKFNVNVIGFFLSGLIATNTHMGLHPT
ncbi:hypothetical protein AVEN_138939-1 [Araneus ventricosus]|uniref:Uncharacterized protein n=1 Tax=Araneus ventricosus TaxID=182803 RepID=A0A4Y2UA67_ARAVE|nr:hypothetical protein AVEN_217239-1 [Araneus ventricosus]GBO09718.1 hypothetical protein AVEN_138939-1 [Araneus ventricosus]